LDIKVVSPSRTHQTSDEMPTERCGSILKASDIISTAFVNRLSPRDLHRAFACIMSSVPTSIPKNFWLALIGLKNISDAFNNAAVEKVLAATKGLPFPVNRRERAHHDKMAVFTDKNPVSASI